MEDFEERLQSATHLSCSTPMISTIETYRSCDICVCRVFLNTAPPRDILSSSCPRFMAQWPSRVPRISTVDDGRDLTIIISDDDDGYTVCHHL